MFYAILDGLNVLILTYYAGINGVYLLTTVMALLTVRRYAGRLESLDLLDPSFAVGDSRAGGEQWRGLGGRSGVAEMTGGALCAGCGRMRAQSAWWSICPI